MGVTLPPAARQAGPVEGPVRRRRQGPEGDLSDVRGRAAKRKLYRVGPNCGPTLGI